MTEESTIATDDFRMPALGADMTEGRVVEWLVEQGQEVARGDLVAVVETDKSDIEIEVFEPCVFEEFLVELNELVPIGQPIARITPTGAPTSTRRHAPAAPQATAADPSTDDVRPTEHEAPTRPTDRRLTPRARRLAAEHGIDRSSLGTDGVVTGDAILERTQASDAPVEPVDRSQRMRSAIAALMEESWRSIPHYHVGTRLDITDVSERLTQYNADRPVAERVVLAAVMNLAVARAAAATPELNGWWNDGRFEPSTTVDLGLIVSLRSGGIVAPTIVDAGQMSLDDMMAAVSDLVGRARRGRLRERDLRPASISLTNMGERGADSVSGVIYPPQVALVGLGAPRTEPTVVGDAIAARTVVRATVAGDHRAHDGLIAARFLNSIAENLEKLP